jgi:hypothetical protein
VTAFAILYWLIIQGRGFGGLLGLIISPFALIVGLLLNELIRKWLGAKKGIHFADFIGVGVVLCVAYFAIPEIR